MRKMGEVSVKYAVRELGVHEDTVRRWCNALLCDETSPLQYCRRDVTGRLWLWRADVERLKDREIVKGSMGST